MLLLLLAALDADEGEVASSLLAAICDRAEATAALMDLLPGGFWTGEAPDVAYGAGTYGVIVEMPGPQRRTTAGRTGYLNNYQVSFFGPDTDVLTGGVMAAWRSAFRATMTRTAPLQVAGEYQMDYAETNAFLVPKPDPGDDGNPIWHQVVEFRVAMGVIDPY